MAKSRTEIRDLSSLLDAVERVEERHVRLPASLREQSVSLGSIVRVIGREAHGPLLLAVGLISISPATLIPGSTWALAALTLVIAVQLAVQREHAWVPRQALRMKVSKERLAEFIRVARPAANAVDKVVKPRWEFFSKPPWVSIVALMCAIAALITFPLGLVPLAPFAPGLAIVLFGLGLTARDGVLLALGAAAMGGALWVLIVGFAA